MKCNNHLPFAHLASCSKGNFVFSIDKTILENSFKSERQENISKIILMLESDLENRMIAIELAKTMELDCYDLCQLVKKKYLKSHVHYFTGFLSVIENIISGMEVETVTRSYNNDYSSRNCIELVNGTYRIKTETDSDNNLIDKLMTYERIFENNPYEWLLLNWDN